MLINGYPNIKDILRHILKRVQNGSLLFFLIKNRQKMLTCSFSVASGSKGDLNELK
jgi:hypothetical protein